MTRRCRIALAIPIVAVALAAAACGGSDAETASSAAATTAPAKTAPTLARAAAEYVALVKPLNAGITGINARIAKARSGSDLSAYIPILEDLSTETAAFKKGLMAIDFPPSVQRQADDTVAASVTHQLALDELVRQFRAGDLPRAQLQIWQTALYEMTGKATVLRNALGLPPAN